ncbi:HotDog domain-containing protein [Endogone sp. FLAS-F59071]|nr:HotDog domain-containing protein [Endogone sp. FLAS-F59071]|eukprot:RUS23279.1 HotDog domain-containing protein [Endogone sp. FLAS-F59071]
MQSSHKSLVLSSFFSYFTPSMSGNSASIIHRLAQVMGHLNYRASLMTFQAALSAQHCTAAAKYSTSNTGPTLRDRALYKFFLPIQTRWSDNDQYSHVNNSIFYLYIDTVVNTYLIRHCNLNPSPGIASTEPIGLVVESNAQFHSSVSFPGIIEAGLAITKLGNSSVRYQVGIFEEGQSQAAVTGGFTHVFVDREGRRPMKIPETMRGGMNKLIVRMDKPEGKE